MKRFIGFAAAATVAGCAPAIISTSPRTVVIRAGDVYVAESQALADVECKKHGRFARLVERPSPRSSEFIYDCVL